MDKKEKTKSTDRNIVCIDCGEEFTGCYRTKRCKPCAKERANALARKRRAANPEKYRTYDRARYAASPKRREQSLASQHRNIERTRATRRKSYNNNRDKILAKAKSDREANPEKYRERKRVAYRANPEKHRKEARDRRAANPEKYRAQAKARYHANPQKFRDQRKKSFENNREEVNRRAKEKRAANLEKYRARDKEAEKRRPAGQALAKSNARKALKQSAILPTTDFDKIKNLYKERTRLTKKTGIEHHVDHIIQLTLGGAHHQDNLRVITAKENLTRGYDYDPTLGGVWANNDRARKTKKKLGIK